MIEKTKSSRPKVLLGVTGGIAAYKSFLIAKKLYPKGAGVKVIITESAQKIVSPEKFAPYADKVYTLLFDKNYKTAQILKDRKVEHIDLAQKSDLIVVAPATANVIGKVRAGICDDLLTTVILASQAQVVFYPSMNPTMWKNPIVKANISELKSKGYIINNPKKGSLACGVEGIGRMPSPESIVSDIYKLLGKSRKLAGKKVLITGGGTKEEIDPIRTIGNLASGKMGARLAEESFLMGGNVLFLKAKDGESPRYPVFVKTFTTGKDLENLIKKYVKDSDYLFHTASVSDFIPEKRANHKLNSRKVLEIKFIPSEKIVDKVKSWNGDITLIAFKAVFSESRKSLIEKGINQLKRSNADYVCVNDVAKEGVGFAHDTNEVYLVGKKGLICKIEKSSKSIVSREILKRVINGNV